MTLHEQIQQYSNTIPNTVIFSTILLINVPASGRHQQNGASLAISITLLLSLMV